jgi:hypothetical protein
MPETRTIADASLMGWRKTVADRVAPPAARRAPASEEQLRAAIGAVFFLLALVYVARTVARLIKSARD